MIHLVTSDRWVHLFRGLECNDHTRGLGFCTNYDQRKRWIVGFLSSFERARHVIVQVLPTVDFDVFSVMPSLITKTRSHLDTRTQTVVTRGSGLSWYWWYPCTVPLLFVIPDEGFRKVHVQEVIMKVHKHILKEV
jgi:hypothetical protein